MRIDTAEYTEACETSVTIATPLTYPHPDWARIAASAERIERIAERLGD